MRAVNVAIVGATGAVGQELIGMLSSRSFPVGELRLLASARSAGREMDTPFGTISVAEATESSFSGVDLAFFSAGASISRALANAAVRAGAVVIDNTSAFRMEEGVPLVVPEVNSEAVREHQGIIANPNCSTIILVVVLKPIYDLAGIRRVVVSTYQAVSGVGLRGIEALEMETRACLDGGEPEPSVMPYVSSPVHHQIAFNLIPHLDVFEAEGYTKEELKMVNETRKIMGVDDMAVSPTAVRVPVFRCHSESLNVETERRVSVLELRSALMAAPGVKIMDDTSAASYPMPAYLSRKDDVYVGRIRRDISCDSAFNLWIVGDQIRKGAALNAVQIGEYMLREDLI